MFTYPFAQVLLVLYAVMLAVGGVIGQIKAGSRPSLIAGMGSAALLMAAVFCSFFWDPKGGLTAAAAITLGLTVFFNYRYVAKTRNFMPAGMLALLSLAVFTCVLVTVVG